MKKPSNLWLPGRRHFMRTGLIGGMGIAFFQTLFPEYLRAGFKPKDDGLESGVGPPIYSWDIELDGDSTGDSVMVTVDLVDNANNTVGPQQPYEYDGGTPVNVPDSTPVPLTLTLNATNIIPANVNGVGSAYCSGIKKDYTIYTASGAPITYPAPAPAPGPGPAAGHVTAPVSGSASSRATALPNVHKHKTKGGLSLDITCGTPQLVTVGQHLWQIPVTITTNQAVNARIIHQAFFKAPGGLRGRLPVSPKHLTLPLTGINSETPSPTVDCSDAAKNGAAAIFAVFVSVLVPGKPPVPVSEHDRVVIPSP